VSGARLARSRPQELDHGSAASAASTSAYRINARPDGLFEPWTWEWQLMQPPPSRNALGCRPATPCGVFTMEGWPAPSWQVWHRKRRAHLEQRRLRRAVRIVTIGAVLRDRLVLPQERPAVFGVTGRAGFRDGVLDQLRRGRRAMRRMAGGAGHLAFAHRMMRGLEQIGVLRLMTAVHTSIWVACGLHRILGSMQRVAARAGHIAGRVRARGPVMRGIRLVAAQALRVLLAPPAPAPWAEVDHAGKRAAARRHMRAARSVAGLALQAAVAEGTVGIVRPRVLGAEDARDAGIVVAAETAVGALRAVCRISVRRCAGRGCGGLEALAACGTSRCEGMQRRPDTGRHAAATPARGKPPHSIRRRGGGECDARPAHPRLRPDRDRRCSSPVRRVGTENRPPFRVLGDIGRAAVLLDVRLGGGPAIVFMAAEQTAMLAEVAIGLPGVVGFGTCVDRPVSKVVACTAVSSTG
jgi:hypothetical protein